MTSQGEVIGQGLHGGIYPVGSGIREDLVSQGTRVDGYGVDAGSLAGLYAQRSVLHYYGFFGQERTAILVQQGTGLGQSLQVGLRVGFSLTDIEGRHHEFRTEHVGVGLVQAVQE